MAKKLQIKFTKRQLVIALITAFFITGVLTTGFLFFLFLYEKVLPGIYVGDVHVGGLSQPEAARKINEAVTLPNEITVRVEYVQPTEYSLPLESIEAHIDYQATVEQAYNLGRTSKYSPLEIQNVELVVKYNEKKLDEQVELISSQTPSPPEKPKLTLSQNTLVFVQGEPGVRIQAENLKRQLLAALKSAGHSVSIKPEAVDPALDPEETERFVQRGNLLLDKSIELVADNFNTKYAGEQMLNLISPDGGYSFDSTNPGIGEIVSLVNTPPKNPVFAYKEGKVEEFSPAKDGLEVDTTALEQKMTDGLRELENTDIDSVVVEIPVKRSPPDFATADVNDLGIKELIGVGKSSFRGSISSRVYNIALAAARLNGVLIPPGETFSFVNTLGDISVFTGFKQAYVISGGQTVLGDGGGVCQVSTTFFRAALAAGLPIAERHAHSYRVGYYEQDSPPGIDATIYHPSVDIKIRNDTPGHILIQTHVDAKSATLRFELYGTGDGRVAEVSKPVVSNVTPPPEDLYVDDPTLPTGEVKQVEYKAWGAKVNFNYTVKREGEIIFEKTYYSNYRPWQAKFLRGTGPTN